MKKLLLFTSFLLCAACGFAQNTMYIDSVVTRPVNPDASDAVYLHVYGWSGYGTSLNGTPTVITAGMTHNVSICYTVGLIAVVTNIHDSVYLFTGPAGMHTVSWLIAQNGTQATSCDQQVDAGQTQVNVSTIIGIHESPPPTLPLWWNTAMQTIYAQPGGMLSVYSADGRLVLQQFVSGSPDVRLPETAHGMFIAVYAPENGDPQRIKFAVE